MSEKFPLKNGSKGDGNEERRPVGGSINNKNTISTISISGKEDNMIFFFLVLSPASTTTSTKFEHDGTSILNINKKLP